MPLLSITVFGGLSPITNPRKLPDYGAVTAEWVRFEASDLRPWRDVAPIDYDTGAGSDMGSPGTIVTKLYRFSVMSASGAFQTRRWLAWQGLRPISPVPSPIPADQFMRLYWTDGASQMVAASSPTMSQTLMGGAGPRVVGIPAPTQQPTGSPVVDQAVLQAQPTEITNAKPGVAMFASHPFKEGNQVNVVINTPEDAAQQNMRELSGKSFFVADVKPGSVELRGSDTTNYSDFVDPSAAMISLVLSESDFDDRVYVFTLVSDWGEEGPPSPPSEIITVRKDGGKANVTLTWARPNGYDHIVTARLYRTLSGQDGTLFFFVKDIPIVGGSPSVPAIMNFVDDVDPLKLGEKMPSQDWTAPIDGMFALTGMPNGFMIAAKGNTLHACEAYQPHAWPDKYRKTVENEINGIATMAQSAILTTSGKPYLATGSDPASLTVTELDVDAPCLSSGSIVSVGAGVVYATHDGLALITPSGSRILTQKILSKQQWAAIWAGTFVAGYHDGRYFALTANSALVSFSLRIDGTGGDMEYTTYPGLLARACAIDTANDSLCFVGLDGSNVFRRLMRIDASLSLKNYVWTSKVFTLAAPANFAVGQVMANTYPVPLVIMAAKIQSDGSAAAMATVHSLFVNSSAPFRLPSGFVAREWQIKVQGQADVQRIDLATSMSELRAA